MTATQDREMIQSCLKYELRVENLFSGMPNVRDIFTAMEKPTFIDANQILFAEGDEPIGAFVILRGRARVSMMSHDEAVQLRIAEAGEILGLLGAISGKPYEATAETIEPAQIGFIARRDLLTFLETNVDVCFRVLHSLSNNLQTSFDRMRMRVSPETAEGKVARLFFNWSEADNQRKRGGLHMQLPVTLSEIGRLVGTSTENVVHLLQSFEERHLIRLRGRELVILDRQALRTLAGTDH